MKHSTVTELRNAMGKLVAKWYPDEGVIEIVVKGCPYVIAVPQVRQSSASLTCCLLSRQQSN